MVTSSLKCSKRISKESCDTEMDFSLSGLTFLARAPLSLRRMVLASSTSLGLTALRDAEGAHDPCCQSVDRCEDLLPGVDGPDEWLGEGGEVGVEIEGVVVGGIQSRGGYGGIGGVVAGAVAEAVLREQVEVGDVLGVAGL
jgi:hypothetical protein